MKQAFGLTLGGQLCTALGSGPVGCRVQGLTITFYAKKKK